MILDIVVPALDKSRLNEIIQQINNKTKPLGALGDLEKVASQLALIQQNEEHNQNNQGIEIKLSKPSILVFAGDHGIAAQGVSIAPSEVTQQMVLNFLAGGAAINCFCRANDIDFKIIDAGIKTEITPTPENLIVQRIQAGTQDFSITSAMSVEQANQAIQLGFVLTQSIIDQGCNLIGFGEMGIANTSSASALLSAFTGMEVKETVGLGTGISNQQLTTKLTCIEKALARLSVTEMKPDEILAELGGFEIAQIVGAILAAAQRQKTIVIDGFIVTVAALIATRIQANAPDYMIFSHSGDEKAHQTVLGELNAKPLLKLGLRLGEGTGAALAMPLIKCAAEFFNNMATFDSAAVEKVV